MSAPWSAKDWPIAAAMLPFPAVSSNGAPVQDADPEAWRLAFDELVHEGFDSVDLTDSWVRPGDLSPARLGELRDAATAAGLKVDALSAIRRSVIDPRDGVDNLAYSHRTIDAAATLGCSVVSVGLHRPMTPDQRAAEWFWTVQGPIDSDDRETWSLAVARLRELGEHAASVDLELSLEMYEDTLLGTPDSSVRLVQDIDRPAVGLNPDLANLYRLSRPIEPFLESIAKCAPYMNYWHVKSYYRIDDTTAGTISSTPAPMESGTMNYRRALAIALEAGFSGPFCVEHYGGDGLAVMARNRDYLRGLLAFDLDHGYFKERA